MTDDFTKLETTRHMLEWLADDPFAAIRSEVESILAQQVPGSKLLSFEVSSEPQWLTGARREDESTQAILVRTGVAFEFRLAVQEPAGKSHHLAGVYSWVGIHLDDPQKVKHRVWLDLDGTLEQLGSEGELMTRMYFE